MAPLSDTGFTRFHEDLNMIAIIGTSDQPCWLAEACKPLLLLHIMSSRRPAYHNCGNPSPKHSNLKYQLVVLAKTEDICVSVKLAYKSV